MILRVRKEGGSLWTNVGEMADAPNDLKAHERILGEFCEELNEHPLRADDTVLEFEVVGAETVTGSLDPGDFFSEGGDMCRGAASEPTYTKGFPSGIAEAVKESLEQTTKEIAKQVAGQAIRGALGKLGEEALNTGTTAGGLSHALDAMGACMSPQEAAELDREFKKEGYEWRVQTDRISGDRTVQARPLPGTVGGRQFAAGDGHTDMYHLAEHVLEAIRRERRRADEELAKRVRPNKTSLAYTPESTYGSPPPPTGGIINEESPPFNAADIIKSGAYDRMLKEFDEAYKGRWITGKPGELRARAAEYIAPHGMTYDQWRAKHGDEFELCRGNVMGESLDISLGPVQPLPDLDDES